LIAKREELAQSAPSSVGCRSLESWPILATSTYHGAEEGEEE
jgi:hypothetical protein